MPTFFIPRLSLLVMLLLAGCASDMDNAREACGDDSMCISDSLASAQQRRQAALLILGAGLQNTGNSLRQSAYYQRPVTTNCWRAGNTMQCSTY